MHWIAVDQLVTKYAFPTSLKAPSSPNCVNLLPAVHAKTDKRWQSSFEYFASHPSLLHWFTYLINMPPTVRFLHLAVVSMEASVGPTNEFCLLFCAVLIAKPETIESINGAFNPLNHVVYNPLHPVPSSFHNPCNFKWSFTKAAKMGSKNEYLRWQRIHIDDVLGQSLTLMLSGKGFAKLLAEMVGLNGK